MQLEYFPLSIRAFSASFGTWVAFVSLSAHYTFSSPEQYTTYSNGKPSDGNVFNPDNIYQPWIATNGREYPINVDPFNSWSLVTSVGVRYKLSALSDLMLDLRYQYFFSDWVDGLNHKLPSNKIMIH